LLRAHNAGKYDCGRSSAPNPARGAYSVPPEPLAGFKGPLCRGKGYEEGRGKEGRGWIKGRKGSLHGEKKGRGED